MPGTRWLPGGALLLVLLPAPVAAAAPPVPGIPTGVTVRAGDGSAVVSWVAPAGEAGISGYRVTASPGGATAQAPGAARSATVTGLANGTAYRFTVTATTPAGTGPPSAVSTAVTPAPDVAPPAGPVLIGEDFATSAAAFVPVAGGSWVPAVGRYVLSAPADGGAAVPNANLAVHGTVVTGDFTLTASGATTPTDSPFNDFSVVFGFQDPANYYFASFSEGNDADTSGVFKVEGGIRTELADIATPIAAGTAYPIRIERAGAAIRVFRAGTSVASTSDAAFPAGRVGFGSRNDGGTFDDLVVTGPARAPSVPDAAPGFLARLWARLVSLLVG